MKIVVMQGPAHSGVVDAPEPKPGHRELLVEVTYSGLCMSEWHPWENAKAGQRFGHEPVGVVVELGPGVESFAVGDRVSGLASTPAFAEYCLIHEERAVTVPANIADEDALAEPLGCLVSAASKLPSHALSDTVAVLGAGYMGLGIISLLRSQGAGSIIAVDPRSEARQNALQFGADVVYAPDDVPERLLVNKWDDGIHERGLGLVAEWAGTQEALSLASDMTAVHGTLAVGAWHQGGLRYVDMRLWGWKGISVLNTHERHTEFLVKCCAKGLTMLSEGTWSYTGVARHIYTLDEFDRANEELAAKPAGFIKGLIRCS